jgi:5'(3')-deoxyribonucleotidase
MEPIQLALPFEPFENEYYIYLDMDGVIVNMSSKLNEEIHKILKDSKTKYHKEFFKKFPNFDLNLINEDYLQRIFISKDVGIELTKEEKYIKSLTYKPLSKNPDLWTNLPVYDGAKDFVEYLLDHWSVTILSSPVDLDSIVGKELWLNNHFPTLLNDAIFETDKYIHANSRAILIDDRPKNINLWVDAGGIGILHTDFIKTKEQLQQYLLT